MRLFLIIIDEDDYRYVLHTTKDINKAIGAEDINKFDFVRNVFVLEAF